jgi:endonuclease YncB( thermonuclease family)
MPEAAAYRQPLDAGRLRRAPPLPLRIMGPFLQAMGRAVGEGYLYLALCAALLTGLIAVVDRSLQPEPPAPDHAGGPPTPASPAAAAAPAPGARRALVLEPPVESVDGITFRLGTRQVRLAGIEGPARTAICTGQDGHLWACGLQARAALHNLVGTQAIACRPVEERGALILASCERDGRDLGRSLVAEGWARPLDAAKDAFAAEVAAARRAGLGLWNGDWKVR